MQELQHKKTGIDAKNYRGDILLGYKKWNDLKINTFFYRKANRKWNGQTEPWN